MRTFVNVLVYSALAVVGLVPAFFGVFNVLLSDVGGAEEYFVALALLFFAYFGAAVAVLSLSRGFGLRHAVAFAAPGMLVAALYPFLEATVALMAAAVVLAVGIGAWSGVAAVEAWRSRRAGG